MKSLNRIDKIIYHFTFKFMFILGLCFSMAVIPMQVQAEDEHEEGKIELTQEQINYAGIDLSTVESGTIKQTLPVYGSVASNAEQVHSISARFEGVIRSVNKSIGDQVKKGETLLTVEANESLKIYSVVSSSDGMVTQRHANIGEQTKDHVLFVIEDFSTVWIDLSLFPKDLAKVEQGQQARIKDVNGTVTSEGKIIYIAPFGNSQTQATLVRVLINNKANQWKPGHFVSAEITLSEVTAAVVIENRAIQLIAGEPVVFVKEDRGFSPRRISLASTDGENSEVLSGLTVGEVYVTKNSFVLKSELSKEDADHGH